MKDAIKNILRPFVPRVLLDKRKISYQKWIDSGCPVPAPEVVKRKIISDYKSDYSILIETGTYLGDMVYAQKDKFRRIVSIELSEAYYKKAKKRFRNDNNVTIIYGDSGKMLPEIVKQLDGPTVFWLDGHYSGGKTAKGEKECPIFEELDAILKNMKYKHIILIDDARSFVGAGDYPTIDYLFEYLKSKSGKYRTEIVHDIIRCIYEA
jgi:hypothetical protein